VFWLLSPKIEVYTPYLVKLISEEQRGIFLSNENASNRVLNNSWFKKPKMQEMQAKLPGGMGSMRKCCSLDT
jgi:hypothetical protein